MKPLLCGVLVWLSFVLALLEDIFARGQFTRWFTLKMETRRYGRKIKN